MTNREFVEKKVHEVYYGEDMNCARTTMVCLSSLFNVKLEEQTMNAGLGMHGAGGFRAQCGLVEGALMFIGVYGKTIGLSNEEVVKACYKYGEEFTSKFGSLTCRELRPGGFREDDPPHLCENLTCDAIMFDYDFISKLK